MKDNERKPKNASFYTWISGCSIYIGHCRYGEPGNGFIVASKYNECEDLQLAIDALSGGDQEASDAADYIRKTDCWFEVDEDPAIAMQKLMNRLREFQRVIDAD